MSVWVHKICQVCESCAIHKAPSEKTTAMTITTIKPFERVAMDFLMISRMPSGYQYALVFINHFTKFAVVVPTNDQTTVTTAILFWEHTV